MTHWNQPPDGAIEWLRACIAYSKDACERDERDDFERRVKRFGVEFATEQRDRERGRSRLAQLVLAITIGMPDDERKALMRWWQESEQSSVADAGASS